jgi:molybdate transport system ATP-binding protein
MRAELDELLDRIDIPIVMITHDPEDLAWFGENTLYLCEGSIAERPAPMPRPIAGRLQAV